VVFFPNPSLMNKASDICELRTVCKILDHYSSKWTLLISKKEKVWEIVTVTELKEKR
jgi:hypothetical protein